jgi:hypothetical protein
MGTFIILMAIAIPLLIPQIITDHKKKKAKKNIGE